MNVIVFASRKGGSGKSTLAAHLAIEAHKPSSPVLMVDADPQGSLSLWHQLRGTGEPPLAGSSEGVRELVQSAKRAGYEWVFIDTPPNMSAVVTDAVSVATLIIIPARLTLFDLAAIKETMVLARQLNKPYAVVINGVPPRRDNAESPFVREARAVLTGLNVPVWSGQITQRNNYSLALAEGEGASEYDGRSEAAVEIAALWSAIEKSVRAIHGAHEGHAMHKVAA
ncbi:MAG TPA: ParA family protein [Xanthobacteraceae bacterium]|jgi:chromosome partitioning protein